MGQRLDIELIANDEALVNANCYYHWSAYTQSALYTLQKVLDNYNHIKDEYKEDSFLLATKCFEIPDDSYTRDADGNLKIESISAGLCESSLKMMKFLYPDVEFQPGIDRNVGLISIHPHDVRETRKWEEGRIVVDLTREEFIFDVFAYFDEEEIIDYLEYSKTGLQDIPFAPKFIEHGLCNRFKFSELDSLIEYINKHPIFKYHDDTGNVAYVSEIA